MSTRTLTLTNAIHNVDNSAAVGVTVSAYLLVPGGGPATNVEGDVLFSGAPYGESTSTASDGSYSLTCVYPGDLTPTGCQLAVVEGTTITLSPVGFSYASSITVSSWYPSGSTTGTLAMLLDVHTVANAADQGVVIRFGISATAIDPNGNAINANRTIPITTDSSGVATLNLYPSSALNPATTTYFIAFPDGTIWYFLCPAQPTGYQGAWNSGTTYHLNSGTKASPADVVSLAGVYYQAVADSTNHTPPNATYWRVFGGEPITWDLTQLTVPGGVVIGASGVTHDPNVAVLVDDIVQAPTTLDDDLHNLAYRTHTNLSTFSTNFTLSVTNHDWIIADAASGNVTLTLPNATARVRPYFIIRKDATANAVTLAAAAGQTINGASTLVLSSQYQWAVLRSDGAAAWYAQTGTGGGALPITTQGDLIVGNGSGTAVRLAIGAAPQILSPVGADVDWITPVDRGGFADPTTQEGDLLYRKATPIASLSIGFLGDSITAGQGVTTAPPASCATDLTTASVTISAINQGVSGTRTSDWLPGGTNDTSAVTAFAACPVVHIMLGTNDAFGGSPLSAATYRANLRQIVNAWVQRGKVVVLSYAPYSTNGSVSTSLLLQFQAQMNSLVDGVRVRQGDTSAYLYFKAHTSEFQGDGEHPNQTGANDLAQLWANALRGVVQALTEETTLQPLHPGSNGYVLTVQGGYPAWQAPGTGFVNPMTTAGDLILGGTAGLATRLPLGSTGQVPTVTGGTVAWANPVTGFADPTTTKGDLIVHGSVTARLGVGTDGQVLIADSTQTAGMKWGDAPVHVPAVTGDTPGPVFMVTGDGQCVLV